MLILLHSIFPSDSELLSRFHSRALQNILQITFSLASTGVCGAIAGIAVDICYPSRWMENRVSSNSRGVHSGIYHNWGPPIVVALTIEACVAPPILPLKSIC